MLRDEHGLASAPTRLPTTQALADVYSRAVNTGRPTREVMSASSRGASTTPTRSTPCCATSWAASARGACSISTTCWSTGAPCSPTTRRRPHPGEVGLGAGRRVPGRQPHPGRHRPPPAARRRRADRRRRRRAGDLRFPRCRRGVPARAARRAARLHAGAPGTQLPLDASRCSTSPTSSVPARCADPARRPRTLGHPPGAGGVRRRRRRGADGRRRRPRRPPRRPPLREQAVLMRAGCTATSSRSSSGPQDPLRQVRRHRVHQHRARARPARRLRVVTNPADEVAWYRLLTRHRAIGKASARTLAARLVRRPPAPDSWPNAPAKSRSALQNTLHVIAEPAQAGRPSPAVPRSRPHAGARPLRRLARGASTMSTGSPRPRCAARPRAFVAEVTLDPAARAPTTRKRPRWTRTT